MFIVTTDLDVQAIQADTETDEHIKLVRLSNTALAIEVDVGLPSERVVRVLDRIVAWRGYPSKMRLDNGPEMISATLAEWAEEHDIELDFICLLYTSPSPRDS